MVHVFPFYQVIPNRQLSTMLKLLICITLLATAVAVTHVELGSAADFVILSKSGITNVPTSNIIGNVGTSPITGAAMTGFAFTADVSGTFWRSTQIVGKIFAVNLMAPTPAKLTTAILDMGTAYTDAASRPNSDHLNIGQGHIGGLTLTPGLYNWASNVNIDTDITISGSHINPYIHSLFYLSHLNPNYTRWYARQVDFPVNW